MRASGIHSRMSKIKPPMSGQELVAALRAGDTRLRVVDARFELSDPAFGKAAYAAGHVPGAVHLDLDDDLSGPKGVHGGRHPLPDLEELATKLGALGIGDEHSVVVYDHAGGMYAGRAVWLLRFAGHDDVRLLDGGLDAYLAAGGVLTTAEPGHARAAFSVMPRPEMVVDAEQVAAAIGSDDVVLLDARAPERYRGETEPLDPKAGHIPGALNRFFAANLQDGRFLTATELRKHLDLPAGVADGSKTVIAYCGSGVTGAHLVLALELAGYPGAKLYAGSWSDWSSRDLPVAVGAEGQGSGG